MENVTLEGGDAGLELGAMTISGAVLQLGDVLVGEPFEREVTLTNHSDQVYRFNWATFAQAAPPDTARKGAKKPPPKAVTVEDAASPISPSRPLWATCSA